MITKDDIQTFFENLKDSDIDSNNQLIYGYFFTDPNATKLESASQDLVKLGYKFVDIFEAEVEDDDEPFFYLHVEKVEKHSVDSLDKVNQTLYVLADKYELESYDGFAAGPIEIV